MVSTIWEQDKSFPIFRTDGIPDVTRVATDRAGNVSILGYYSVTSGEGGGDEAMPFRVEKDVTDFFPYVARYAAHDGALIWQKSPGELYKEGIYPMDLGMDSTGNVYLTASDVLAAKYAASDGSEVWRVPIKDRASGALLSVDAGGDPVFCATAISRGGIQYHTGKLDSRDGSLLWSRRYPNSPRRHTRPFGLALGAGIVAVTGETLDRSTTIKYADGPTPRTLSAELLDNTIARLHGEVIPNRFICEAAFIYGSDPALRGGIRTELVSIGNGADAVKIEATLSGLRPHTRYYYCALGKALNGETVRGEVQTFETISTPLATLQGTQNRCILGQQTSSIEQDGSVCAGGDRQMKTPKLREYEQPARSCVKCSGGKRHPRSSSPADQGEPRGVPPEGRRRMD
jgi:outer membrane protein assembly factor BamB